MPVEWKSILLSGLQENSNMYISDLAAIPADQVAKSPGGVARSAADFTYEIIVINDRIMKRMDGEDPGPWPFTNGYAVAPEELHGKDALLAAINRSLEELLARLTAMDEDEFSRPITMTDGTERPLHELLQFLPMHLAYHDGQLNYIQALNGDGAVHWD
jgi:uncharacterized damage-inducible protein DinB